ncbi:MAG TPA: glycosyltransferase family 4 protein [Thermodesulfobacteriota bacterium]|nr:glycosyltransferase family 4 protein [Thermodesulfobacteriota bacterium]
MTTFIDFRYARTLFSALLSPHQSKENAVSFDPLKDNYVAFEFSPYSYPEKLLDLVTGESAVVASMYVGEDQSLSFELASEKIILKTPPGLLPPDKKSIFGFRLGPQVVGFKLCKSVHEERTLSLLEANGKLGLRLNNNGDSIRILGLDSGRAQKWAELYYHRSETDGLGVEIVLDWHHLRSGIPLAAVLMTEKLIEHSSLRLKFHSYVLDKKEAQHTDFALLFTTCNGDPDVSLHITPPIYTRFNAKTTNVGLFVYESTDIPPAIIGRCNLMDSIIVPSTFAKHIFYKAGVHRPIYVVPHGIDLEFFRPVPERTPLPGGKGFNFLAISTSVERKNMRQLVRAFLEEFRKDEDVALFIFLRPEFRTTQNNVALEFEDWEKRYYRKSAPIFLSTDSVRQETLRDFYANADAYVMPSNEGFGLTLLEAMASGTPAVGLKYGGVLDFLNEANGYLVPTGRGFVSKDRDVISYTGDRFYEPDIKKLRAVMRHIFENPKEARERGRQGRRDCERYYTWDHTAREIANILEETYVHNNKPYVSIQQKNGRKLKSISLSWVLCVHDDELAAESIKYLRKIKTSDNEVLCLFTRYARLADIMLARRSGFLFHRWDGSYTDCKATVQSTILTPWAGILYSGEKIEGDLESLIGFLEIQPEEVCEVLVPCGNGSNQPRFIRSQPPTVNTEKRIFKKVIICQG